MEFSRAQRVAEEMKKEIARIIQDELKDPRVGFVSITGVKVSNDLRHAKIYVSIFGNKEEETKSLEVLKKAKGFIRKEIGKQIKLRYTPEIVFLSDHSIAYSDKITRLLTEVKSIPGKEEK